MRQHLGWWLPDQDQHFAGWLQPYPGTSYQQQALDEAVSRCGQRGLALDIGANIGLFATRLSAQFDRVMCWEPTTPVYDCLRQNCAAIANVELFKVGLGDRAGLATISIPKLGNNCGQYSMVDFQDLAQDREDERVPVMTLDQFDTAPDFIKIDTQGFEPWILRGAVETLRRHRPVLLLEVEGKAVRSALQEVLAPLGYQPCAAVRHDQIWIKV